MTLSIPSGPEELTAGWLSDALHEGGHLLNGYIKRASIEPLDSSKGVYGTLVRLPLEYSTGFEMLPSTMIAKLPSSNPNSAEQLRVRGGDRAEVGFYQEVGQSVGLRIPECFFSALDETTGRFVLLLEDLSPHRSPSATDSLTENEIAAVVKSLAASHDAWWEHPRLTELNWLRPFDAGLRSSSFLVGWEVLVERLGGGAPGLGTLGAQVMRTVTEAEERLASPPTTLLHMDVRQENLFFAGSDENPYLSSSIGRTCGVAAARRASVVTLPSSSSATAWRIPS